MDDIKREVEIGKGLKVPTESALNGLRLVWRSIKENDLSWRDFMLVGVLIVSIISVVTNFIGG